MKQFANKEEMIRKYDEIIDSIKREANPNASEIDLMLIFEDHNQQLQSWESIESEGYDLNNLTADGSKYQILDNMYHN